MTDITRYQHRASDTAGVAPPSLLPHEIAVNTADRKAWVGDSAGKPVLLVIPAAPTDVRSLGLICDGVTDDAPALLAAIKASTGPLMLRFPTGRTYFATGISFPDSRNVILAGNGMAATTITFGPGVDIGFSHGQAAPGQNTFHIRDMTILPTASGGTAVRVSQNIATNPAANGFSAENVQIGSVGTGPCWKSGIDLHGAWNSYISNVYIFQPTDAAIPGNVGVSYAPSETAEAAPGLGTTTTVLTCDNLFTQNGTIGLQILGNVQGINLVNCNISGPLYGVQAIGPAGNAGSGTIQITNSQINASVRNIQVVNFDNPIITGNLLLQFDQFVAHNWAAVELENAPFHIVQSNYILNAGGPVVSNVAAILVSSTQAHAYTPSRIAGNILFTQNKCPVELQGTALSTVMDNEFWNRNGLDPAFNRVLQTPAPAWAVSTIYPPYSAVTSAGLNWTTVAGGVSGSAGPSGSDGSVAWVSGGPSLLSYPNSVSQNAVYGMGKMREDASGNLTLGTSPPTSYIKLLGFLQTASGMQTGSPGYDGLLDLFSAATNGANRDARVIVINGTNGATETGDLYFKAGSINMQAPKLGFFSGPAVAKPTITGSRGGSIALASLLAQLQGLSLLTDNTTA